MGGRKKEPVDLIIAKGKTNLTKAEIERRRAQELKVPFINITAPDYLPEKLVPEFYEISDQLLALNIMTELDEDALARYLLAKEQYLELTIQYNKALKEEDLYTMGKIQTMQDKSFKQCRASASDLGLTITSRARMVVPQVEAPKENKFVAKFGNSG